jgi:hypothetical protein
MTRTTFEDAADALYIAADGSMSWDSAVNRQEAVETACHNAIRAMHDQAAIAHREGRVAQACMILAVAINQLILAGITSEQLPDCMMHLTRQAAPRRANHEHC